MGDPLLGAMFQGLGGLASASFYVPYTRIRGWSWEVFWIAGGLFSWLLAPSLAALLLTRDLPGVLAASPHAALGGCVFWGAMWGVGGLTFGMTMRTLGLSLGFAISLGLTTVIATLGPPLFGGSLGLLAASAGGRLILLGIALTIVGMVVVGRAGLGKQRDLAARGSAFPLKRGLALAAFSGVTSGTFAGGILAGAPIRALTLSAGTPPVWQSLPVLSLILAGGLLTNLAWCAWRVARTGLATPSGALPARNMLLAAFGGTLWFVQFLFYAMGESRMGRFGASNWALHIAPIILFATLWGVGVQEWAGVSATTRVLLWSGVGILVGATMLIGLGGLLNA